MSRYVDADKVYEMAITHKDFKQSIADLVSLKEVLDDIPTADVVEVVRCKNCQMAEEDQMIDGWYYCNNNELSHKPNHFCSYREREEKKRSY